jgi:hypothetical protein
MMRHRLASQSGQLFAPMILLLLFFAAFLAGFAGWCRAIYWQMRMDMVAEMVALSAARAQAAMLNNIATLQNAENFFLQKATVIGVDVAHMQLALKPGFEFANNTLKFAVKGAKGQTYSIAQAVARANHVALTVPYPKPELHLVPVQVYVAYFVEYFLEDVGTYDQAYFTRQWGRGKMTPQPDHETTWAVSKFGIVGTATARVWLDVQTHSFMNDGGFPAEDMPWWREIGIQCFYPQFNARLVRTNAWANGILRQAMRTTP